MDAAEFDLFAEEYESQHRSNIAITGEDPAYFSAYKIKVLAEILQSRPRKTASILDFGSGIGNSVPYFREYLPGCRLICADVSAKSLALAKSRFPGREEMLPIAGDMIPGEAEFCDAVFSACVFHHISHEQHEHWLTELYRVTRPGGTMTVFEHNPLNPLTVRAVNTCPFDRNARLLRVRRFVRRCEAAGWRDFDIRYHVFFPRALASLRVLDRVLSRVPLGAQYSVTASKPL